MKLLRSVSMASGLLLASLVGNANAATIGFENLANGGIYSASSIDEAGYDISAGLAAIVSPSYVDAATYGPAWTSDFLSFCTCNGNGVALISRADKALFSVASFDVAAMQGVVDLTITGVKADDSQIIYTVGFDSAAWTSIDLMGLFTDLKSFSIAGTQSAGISLDNIAVDSPAAVPVPASAWLFGSGLAGLVARARRRKN